jgi:hypothetical protein
MRFLSPDAVTPGPIGARSMQSDSSYKKSAGISRRENQTQARDNQALVTT